jgi:hypothetical protein
MFVFEGYKKMFQVENTSQEENVDGQNLSVLRAGSRDGKRGQSFEPPYPSSLADQPSKRQNRCGRRFDFQGPGLRQVPEVRVRQKSGEGVSFFPPLPFETGGAQGTSPLPVREKIW